MNKTAAIGEAMKAIGDASISAGKAAIKHPFITAGIIGAPIAALSVYDYYVKNYGNYFLNKDRNDLMNQNNIILSSIANNQQPKQIDQSPKLIPIPRVVT